MKKILIPILLVVLGAAAGFVWWHRRIPAPRVAAGYRLETVAEFKGPGALAIDPRGRILVSQPEQGKVILLPDRVVLEDLTMPFGLAFFENYLYVAETHQVSRWQYDVEQGRILDAEGVNIVNLVPNDFHPLRSLILGPNYRDKQIISGNSPIDTLTPDKLYIGSGSTCNACIEATWKSAAILESDPEGTYTAEFAGGLRNPLGLAINPATGELWATEQGVPGRFDELNIIRAAAAEHEFGARRYGWPFCFGEKLRDETFNPTKIDRIDIPQDCAQTEPPAELLAADADPTSIAFWRSGLVLGLRDSLTVNNQSVVTSIAPSALVVAPDGALLVADSRAGRVYRLTIE